MANSTASTDDREQWLTRPEACRRLQCGPRAIRHLIESGRLSVLHVPGSFPRLRADEIEQLRARAFRPATCAPPAGGAA